MDTYLLYYLLRSLSSCFLLLGHIIIKEWDFKPSAKAQVLAPTTYYYFSIILFEPFAIDGIHQVIPIHPFALTSLITKGPSYLGTNLDGLANLLMTCLPFSTLVVLLQTNSLSWPFHRLPPSSACGCGYAPRLLPSSHLILPSFCNFLLGTHLSQFPSFVHEGLSKKISSIL